MKAILGTKEYMTQIFTEDGNVVPVTVVRAPEATVLLVRTEEKDGYRAVQVGSGEKRESRVSKPEKGHFGDLGGFQTVREFRLNQKDDAGEISRGDTLSIENFEAGDIVNVSGNSKGKGFQGVVKRHGFAGGRRSHGQKHSEREPGSIGATGIARVLKGTRMPGRMGNDRVTTRNLKIAKVDAENGLLFIKGAVPGRKGTVLEIRASNAKKALS